MSSYFLVFLFLNTAVATVACLLFIKMIFFVCFLSTSHNSIDNAFGCESVGDCVIEYVQNYSFVVYVCF